MPQLKIFVAALAVVFALSLTNAYSCDPSKAANKSECTKTYESKASAEKSCCTKSGTIKKASLNKSECTTKTSAVKASKADCSTPCSKGAETQRASNTTNETKETAEVAKTGTK